ncbi:hypothetical protein [Rhodopirellula europaea]|uniref:hypothetical protein n=1 Tax=Rhodopirellula europaea TaxID=1263866 RepID=UPI003D2E4D9D
MKETHAPGPWSYEICTNTPSTFAVSDGHCTIALVERWDADPETVQREAESNAALVASAPLLLDAIKTILPRFVELYETFDPEGEIAVWGQWRELVEGAIDRTMFID